MTAITNNFLVVIVQCHGPWSKLVWINYIFVCRIIMRKYELNLTRQLNKPVTCCVSYRNNIVILANGRIANFFQQYISSILGHLLIILLPVCRYVFVHFGQNPIIFTIYCAPLFTFKCYIQRLERNLFQLFAMGLANIIKPVHFSHPNPRVPLAGQFRIAHSYHDGFSQ